MQDHPEAVGALQYSPVKVLNNMEHESIVSKVFIVIAISIN